MPQRKRTLAATPKFAVGDRVRVKHDIKDADYPDMPLGGWAGTVSESHTYGIFYEARHERRLVTLPLGELEVKKGQLNRRLIEDYRF